MKTFSLLLLSIVLPAATLNAQSRGVVTVKFQDVFEEYIPLRKLDQEMRMELQAFREEQAAKLQALQAGNQRFQELRGQAAAEDVSEEERERLIEQAGALFEELRASEQKLRQEQQAYNQEIESRAGRLRREVVDSILEHIQGMSRERGWTVVLDSSARGNNGLPTVLFADPGTDVTREVIRSLNRAAAEEEAEATDDPAAAEEE